MKNLGVSVFLGLGQSADENASYLILASALGYNRLFTSLHIPEADPDAFLSDGRKLLELAAKLGFSVTADISPRTWSLLGLQPEELKNLGITALRADWGFSPEQLLDLSKRSGLQLEINASVIDEAALEQLMTGGLSTEHLRAGHNYYPRPETGLSYELFCRRSRLLAARGIPVSVFIPGKSCQRGPIHAGLPTVETHRKMTAVAAARQLWTSGCVDAILFGDPLIADDELAAVAAVPKDSPEIVELRARACVSGEVDSSLLWAPLHTNRLDASACVVRSQESRTLHRGRIAPHPTAQPRHRGDITVDNSLYSRYEGELQIILTELPADARVNIVGRVVEEDMCLLDCLEPGRKFRLREVTGDEL